MNKHPKFERTLVVVKPDGIQRNLVGEIVGRFEKVGLKLVGIKMMVPTAKLIEEHYTLDEGWMMKTGLKSIKSYTDKGLVPPDTDPLKVTQRVLKNLVKYMTSGPVVAMVWEGAHAVEVVRKIVGGTEPRSSDVGTIRGDYVMDSYILSDHDGRAVRNILHASGCPKEAKDEVDHWFKKSEIVDYSLINERVIYNIDLEDILK